MVGINLASRVEVLMYDLRDVVVIRPTGTHGGVIQYDC